MNILVLGGGISGLSAAWYARKAHPHAKISLLEKGPRLGGWIETVESEGSYFEMGPRTFVFSRSPNLLQLIEELGLKNKILISHPKAATRFLWNKGALRKAQSFMPMLLRGLICEAFVPKKIVEDESIYDYASRRLGSKIAETLLDPMTLGIYSGDIRKLSLRSCFPFLHEWERDGRSVLRALIGSKKDGRLFTLKRGVGSLIDALEKQLDADIYLNCPVEAIEKDGVYAGGKFWAADKIISALPGQVLSRLTQSEFDLSSNSIWVVSFGFETDILKEKGFGYLIPSKEKESVLGMVWDSAIFPREESGYQTIVTAMVRNLGDQTWAEVETQSAIFRHLGHIDPPDFIETRLVKEAIPQFVVGYAKRLAQFQSSVKERFPKLSVIGNYIDGVSVDACIRLSKDISIN